MQQELLQQIIYHYEEQNGFSLNYKDRAVEELEQIIIDFQSLYVFGDYPEISRSLASEEDLIIFQHWEVYTQANFLAYLAIKIAVARS